MHAVVAGVAVERGADGVRQRLVGGQLEEQAAAVGQVALHEPRPLDLQQQVRSLRGALGAPVALHRGAQVVVLALQLAPVTLACVRHQLPAPAQVPRPQVSTSCEASSRSADRSRIVSSMAKRLRPSRTEIVTSEASTKRTRAGATAPAGRAGSAQVASAARSVHPPEKTASRR